MGVSITKSASRGVHWVDRPECQHTPTCVLLLMTLWAVLRCPHKQHDDE